MVYARTEEEDRFAYCGSAEQALAAARGFLDQGAISIEISDASGSAFEVEEFERLHPVADRLGARPNIADAPRLQLLRVLKWS